MRAALALFLLVPLGACEPSWRAELQSWSASKPLPEFPLIDQHSDDVSLHDQPTLITFAFSRCAVPTACPQTIEKVREVESSVRTVVVTLDPEYDTPAVLSQWAQRTGLKRTTFATASRDVIDALASCFNVFTTREMAHPVKAALLVDGRVTKTWTDNSFSAAEVSAHASAR
jgi:cytochrome oxidase Cu insertion factor (SCO1/SenC/PrrC family)